MRALRTITTKLVIVTLLAALMTLAAPKTTPSASAQAFFCFVNNESLLEECITDYNTGTVDLTITLTDNFRLTQALPDIDILREQRRRGGRFRHHYR